MIAQYIKLIPVLREINACYAIQISKELFLQIWEGFQDFLQCSPYIGLSYNTTRRLTAGIFYTVPPKKRISALKPSLSQFE